MVRVRKATIDDMWFQFGLRNEPYVVKTCTSQEKVGRGEHRKWFINALSRKDKYALFIVERGSKKIGYIWFKRSAWEGCEVSIAIEREYQYKGYGKSALNMTLAQPLWGVEVVVAKVREDNPASIGFFKNSGFEEVFSAGEDLLTFSKRK
jgi:RimJ/RimL family protein N-acetyltransferase